jgi:hypothetical protein
LVTSTVSAKNYSEVSNAFEQIIHEIREHTKRQEIEQIDGMGDSSTSNFRTDLFRPERFVVPPSTFIQDIKSLFNDESTSDLVIELDDGSQIFAHKALLLHLAEELSSLISASTVTFHGKPVMKLPKISLKGFNLIMEFIAAGDFPVMGSASEVAEMKKSIQAMISICLLTRYYRSKTICRKI